MTLSSAMSMSCDSRPMSCARAREHVPAEARVRDAAPAPCRAPSRPRRAARCRGGTRTWPPAAGRTPPAPAAWAQPSRRRRKPWAASLFRATRGLQYGAGVGWRGGRPGACNVPNRHGAARTVHSSVHGTTTRRHAAHARTTYPKLSPSLYLHYRRALAATGAAAAAAPALRSTGAAPSASSPTPARYTLRGDEVRRRRARLPRFRACANIAPALAVEIIESDGRGGGRVRGRPLQPRDQAAASEAGWCRAGAVSAPIEAAATLTHESVTAADSAQRCESIAGPRAGESSKVKTTRMHLIPNLTPRQTCCVWKGVGFRRAASSEWTPCPVSRAVAVSANHGLRPWRAGLGSGMTVALEQAHQGAACQAHAGTRGRQA